MIQQIDEIPLSTAGKRRSYREMIQNDIREAIDKRIEKFEFLGDYNWKYLQSYAKEEADRIWIDTWYEIMREARVKHGLSGYMTPDYHDKGKYIKVSSVKMDDRIHVYCQIDFDAPQQICGRLIEELIAQKEARENAIEAKDLNAHIGEVGLSTRAFTCLSRAGYRTMADLEGKTATDLIKIRNMGRKSVEEIINLMRRFGMEVEAND